MPEPVKIDLPGAPVVRASEPRAVIVDGRMPGPDYGAMAVALLEVGYLETRKLDHLSELTRRQARVSTEPPVFSLDHIRARVEGIAQARELLTSLAAGEVVLAPCRGVRADR